MQTSAISIVVAAFVTSAAVAQRADVLVRPETGEVITLDGAAQVSHIEPRIPLDPPKPDDPIPESATAVMTISSPGSYFLTGNLNGGSGVCGIDIQSSNVTLDLSGYSLVGLAGSLDAVTSSTGGTNIIIANGTIRGWGGDGVDGRKINSCQVANILVANCGGDGIVISRGLIKNCQARLCDGTGIGVINGKGGVSECRVEDCGQHGIECGEMSAVVGCSSTGNTLDGFRLGRGSTIEDCTGSQNQRDGIAMLNHGTVRGCSTFNNGRDGIRTGNKSTVIGCTANTNTGNGITASTGVSIDSCTACSNGGDGIEVSRGIVRGCDASLNDENGIFCHNGSVIEDCKSRVNGNHGIYGEYALVVKDCSVNSNWGSGIYFGACCNHVQGCYVSGNVGSAIRVLHSSYVHDNHIDGGTLYAVNDGNRIEGNHVSRGTIDVDGADNFVFGNSADTFSVVGGNILGVIRTTVEGAGPWDNFEY